VQGNLEEQVAPALSNRSEVDRLLSSPQFLELAAECIMEFPTETYPFRDLVVSAMGLPSDLTDRLHCLHDAFPGFSPQRTCKKEKVPPPPLPPPPPRAKAVMCVLRTL